MGPSLKALASLNISAYMSKQTTNPAGITRAAAADTIAWKMQGYVLGVAMLHGWVTPYLEQ